MSDVEGRPRIHLIGDENRELDAIWSRSGKRLVVSVYRDVNAPMQVELTVGQAEDLGRFLLDSIGSARP